MVKGHEGMDPHLNGTWDLNGHVDTQTYGISMNLNKWIKWTLNVKHV